MGTPWITRSILMQVCVWNVSWEKQKGIFLQMPGGKLASPSDTHVQFHRDENHFLAMHKTHLGIYEARELICVKQVAALSLSHTHKINRSLLLVHCAFKETNKKMSEYIFLLLYTVGSRRIFCTHLRCNFLV